MTAFFATLVRLEADKITGASFVDVTTPLTSISLEVADSLSINFNLKIWCDAIVLLFS